MTGLRIKPPELPSHSPISMTGIFFCGDAHGRFEHVITAVLEYRPAAVIFLGDLQAKQPLEQELAPILDSTDIWYIHGNHDTDSDTDYNNLFGSTLRDRNLHGRVVEIAGLRIAGLGGVFRRQVWMPPDAPTFETTEEYLARAGKGNWWRGDLPRKHRSTIFPEDYFALAKQNADVLVSHEAPSCHPHGFAAIEALARSLGVSRAFHGHHHDCLDYRGERSNLGFAAYGVGLRGIAGLDGESVLAGEQPQTFS